jgi:integrase
MASRRGSLSQLLAAYVTQLKARQAASARSVEALFARAVLKPFPDLARTKATEIEPTDVQRVLARLVEKGLTREVNKLRSYLSAAFQHGSRLDNDPRRLVADKVVFNIDRNPVFLIPRIAEYERAGDRALSETELARFWKATKSQSEAVGCFLRFNLALGGQRVSQLLRTTWQDYDFAAQTVTLIDSKGRTAVKRPHVVPLTSLALAQLRPMQRTRRQAPGPFSMDGKRVMAIETLSKAVRTICEGLRQEDAKLDRKAIPRFRMGDLRRTCETLLAMIGVSKDDRAQLLSHGLTGVQVRHYDRNLYLDEKKRALRKWEGVLRRLANGRGADRPT